MKLDEAREVLGVTAEATEDDIKKQFRKFAMQWHPDKAAHCTLEEKGRREEKMKEINSAYVRLQKGEDTDDDEDDDYFPTGPWSMPDELIALLMDTLFQQRSGKGRRGGRSPGGGFCMGGGGGASFSFDIPMRFDHGGGRGPPGRGGHGSGPFGGAYYDDDSGAEDDSDEEGCHFSAYEQARPRRRAGQYRSYDADRNVFSQEDWEKNRAAQTALEEHQKREAERLEMRRQKAEVMKVIDKLPKPVKTDVTDSSITLTIDRNRKFRGSLPSGGFWELQFRQTHGRGDEHSWRPYAERLRNTTATVSGLLPGTSYDFRARGGFEGMGDVSMGGLSVTATVSTTGRKPATAAAAAPAAAASVASQKSAGKGNARAARSTSDAMRAGNEQADAGAPAGSDEAEQRRQAQREEAAAREAAVAAAARDAAAKREAERQKAVQARLDQEAEEYAKLMAQHARSGGAAAGGDGKKKKKKKQKKDSESTPATSAAPAADPIPESMEAVFDSGAAVDQWTSCHSDNAPAGDDWKPVRIRERPKAPPNGVKAAPLARPESPPQHTTHSAHTGGPGAPVFEDVSPDQIRRLREERAAVLAAEEELMLQEALARSLSETRMDAAELLRLETEAMVQQAATARAAAERQLPHRGAAAGGVRGAHADDGAAAAAAAAAASAARRVAASGGLPRAGGRGRGAQRGRGAPTGRSAEDGGGRGRRGRGRAHAHSEWSTVEPRRSAQPPPEHRSTVRDDPITEPLELFDPIPEPALTSPIQEPLDESIPEHTSDYSTTLHEPFGTPSYTLPQTPDYIQQSFDQPEYQPEYPSQHDPVQPYTPPDSHRMAYAPHDAYGVSQQATGHSPAAAYDNGTFPGQGVLPSQPAVHEPPPAAADTWAAPPEPSAIAGAPSPFGGGLGGASWGTGAVGVSDTAIRSVDAAGAGGGLGVRPGVGRGPSTQGRLFQAYSKRHPGAAHVIGSLGPAGGTPSPAAADIPGATDATSQPQMVAGQQLDRTMAPVATSEPAFDPLPPVQPVASTAFASAQSTLSPDSASFQPQPQPLWGYGGQGSSVHSSNSPLDTSMYRAAPAASGAPQYRMGGGVPSYSTPSQVNLPETLLDTPSAMSAQSHAQVQPHPPAHPPPPMQHNGMATGGYYGMQNGRTAADTGMYGSYGFSTGHRVAPPDGKQLPYDPQGTAHQQQPPHMQGWYQAAPPGMYMHGAAWGPPHYPMSPVPHGIHVAPVNGYHGHTDASSAGQPW